jgi:hypothetical protein
MKTSCNERDWALTVLAVKNTTLKSGLLKTCREMFSRKASWTGAPDSLLIAGSYRSKIKHFMGDLPDSADRSPRNEIREITVDGARYFEYPIYAGLAVLEHPVVFVGAPYVNLSRDIWTGALRKPFASGEYMAPKLGEVFHSIAARKVANVEQALSKRDSLTILRSGRINITNDPNLHGVVLIGNNVMQSDLYKHLDPVIDEESGLAWLSRTAAKFGFWGTARRRIVVRLDRFGNYRMRPGIGGERLLDFADFLRFLDTIQAVDWRRDFPGSRSTEMTADEVP